MKYAGNSKLFPFGSEADRALQLHREGNKGTSTPTIEYARYYSNVPANGEEV